MTSPSISQDLRSSRRSISYHTVDIEGLKIFYREAGPANAPTVLLLHGFPSSSRMWEPLLPLLADKYHLIAPGLSGVREQQRALSVRLSNTLSTISRT